MIWWNSWKYCSVQGVWSVRWAPLLLQLSWSCTGLTCWQRLLQLILYPLPLTVSAFGCYIHTTVKALHLHSDTQSHWSSGSTVCFPPGRQLSVSRWCTHTYNGTGFSCQQYLATLVIPTRVIKTICEATAPTMGSFTGPTHTMWKANVIPQQFYPITILLAAGPSSLQHSDWSESRSNC